MARRWLLKLTPTRRRSMTVDSYRIDTLLDATGRHYYRGCYIEGATDFIFGTGKAFFEVIRIDFAALRLLVLRHIITLFMCY